jgi:hypothetical protein
MTDHSSAVPHFTIAGVTFACWVVDDGQRYVWRSTCGRYAAGRMVRAYWSRRDGRVVGAEFLSLKLAMVTAVGAAQWRVA